MKRLYQFSIILILCGVLATGSAFAAQKPQVVRGSFKQLKYLAELEQPLVSTGHFVMAAGKGLIWQVKNPVQTKLLITRDYLVRHTNGQRVAHINAEDQPALRVVAAVLLAVFQTDLEQLKQYFEIDKKQVDSNQWRMTLDPANAGVAKFIECIRVQGGDHIRRIEIHQPNGDRSVIKLHPTEEGASTLTADEKAQFSH